jgi:tripartite-type tricarboxylate transporter receptor subunit TctC
MAEPFYAQSPEYWRDQRSFFEETIMIAVARSVLVALSLVLAGAPAAAQSFPTKPVHILVPYAPGGAVDVLARTIGQSGALEDLESAAGG